MDHRRKRSQHSKSSNTDQVVPQIDLKTDRSHNDISGHCTRIASHSRNISTSSSGSLSSLRDSSNSRSLHSSGSGSMSSGISSGSGHVSSLNDNTQNGVGSGSNSGSSSSGVGNGIRGNFVAASCNDFWEERFTRIMPAVLKNDNNK